MTRREKKEARMLKLWNEQREQQWRTFRKLGEEKEERVLIANGFYPTQERISESFQEINIFYYLTILTDF